MVSCSCSLSMLHALFFPADEIFILDDELANKLANELKVNVLMVAPVFLALSSQMKIRVCANRIGDRFEVHFDKGFHLFPKAFALVKLAPGIQILTGKLFFDIVQNI